MKANKILIILLLIVINGCLVHAYGQKNLNAIAEKMENGAIPDVDVSVVEHRDPNTKRIDRRIVSLSTSANPALKQEIIAAFEKDKAEAYSVIENKKNGVVNNLFYKFFTDEKEVSYSINPSKEDKISLSIIENYH